MSDLAGMTKQSQSVIFFGAREADHVAIEPLGKVVPGWRPASVAVQCGVWTGHYTGQFIVGELAGQGDRIPP